MKPISTADALIPGALERAGYKQDDEPKSASPGQVLIMFAIFMTTMIGVLGLSIDVGYSVSQRRMMQNAADLAAIAGALSISNYSPTNQISSMTAIQNTIDGNQTHEGSPALESCDYINDSLYEVSACDAYVPADATGVTITVRETHETFFVRAVPGAPTQVTTRATAAARVERLFRGGTDAPFMVCGYDTKLMDGSELSILSSNNFVNPAAVGKTFRVMGTIPNDPAAEPNFATCGLAKADGSPATGWRGAALGNAHNGMSNERAELGTRWWVEGGASPKPIRYNVQGLDGCQQGDRDPYNCVMLLPIAIDEAHGGIKPVWQTGGSAQFTVTKVLAFVVTKCGTACYSATLLDDYPTFGSSVAGWCRDCGAVTVIKLKE